MSLLERVLMKDFATATAPEDIKSVLKVCLEEAAMINYTTLSQKANIEGA